jgi:hypothetical protein
VVESDISDKRNKDEKGTAVYEKAGTKNTNNITREFLKKYISFSKS